MPLKVWNASCLKRPIVRCAHGSPKRLSTGSSAGRRPISEPAVAAFVRALTPASAARSLDTLATAAAASAIGVPTWNAASAHAATLFAPAHADTIGSAEARWPRVPALDSDPPRDFASRRILASAAATSALALALASATCPGHRFSLVRALRAHTSAPSRTDPLWGTPRKA